MFLAPIRARVKSLHGLLYSERGTSKLYKNTGIKTNTFITYRALHAAAVITISGAINAPPHRWTPALLTKDTKYGKRPVAAFVPATRASHGAMEKRAQRTSADRVAFMGESNTETQGAEMTQVYAKDSFQSCVVVCRSRLAVEER